MSWLIACCPLARWRRRAAWQTSIPSYASHPTAGDAIAKERSSAAVTPVGVPGRWRFGFSDEIGGTCLDLDKWRPKLAGGIWQPGRSMKPVVQAPSRRRATWRRRGRFAGGHGGPLRLLATLRGDRVWG